jgi:hypothetical protein
MNSSSTFVSSRAAARRLSVMPCLGFRRSSVRKANRFPDPTPLVMDEAP